MAMTSTTTTASGPADPAGGSAARRLRFRASVSGLAARAQATDLLRWVLLPGAAAIIIGLNFMILGWVGAARTAREIEQIPYLISGGLLGLALVFLGGLLLASAFWMVLLKKLQDEAEERARRDRDALEQRLSALLTVAPAPNGTGTRPRARKARAVSSAEG